MGKFETLLLVAIGCASVAVLVWYVWFPADLRRVLTGKPEQWPRRNVGGGYDWPDGRITRDKEGRGPDLRDRT